LFTSVTLLVSLNLQNRIAGQSDLWIDGLAQLTSNDYLILAGTLHGIHAITSRLSPAGSSSGAQVIESESFKMNILLTPTGSSLFLPPLQTSYAVTRH
jgi:hypothetical protein